MSISRHCERSEAIHRAAQRKSGLLRFARNDVDKPQRTDAHSPTSLARNDPEKANPDLIAPQLCGLYQA